MIALEDFRKMVFFRSGTAQIGTIFLLVLYTCISRRTRRIGSSSLPPEIMQARGAIRLVRLNGNGETERSETERFSMARRGGRGTGKAGEEIFGQGAGCNGEWELMRIEERICASQLRSHALTVCSERAHHGIWNVHALWLSVCMENFPSSQQPKKST